MEEVKKVRRYVYRHWMDLLYWFNQVAHLRNLKAVSHSSSGEDDVIEYYLPEGEGEYLDIGAGHPSRGSNTYKFYRKGWRGVTVEPIWAMNKLHKMLRPYDRQVMRVVADEQTDCLMFEFNPTEYSTISTERLSFLIKNGAKPRRIYLIKSITLKDLLKRVSPFDAFLLSVDVEGEDKGIIRQLTLMESRPRVVCVEVIEESAHEIHSLLSSVNYKLVSKTGNNSIFVHEEFLLEGKQ